MYDDNEKHAKYLAMPTENNDCLLKEGAFQLALT